MINKLLILLITYLLNTAITFADFGETCSALALAPSDNYLQMNTLYGYLINNLDVKTYVTDPCNPNDEKINFCFRESNSSGQRCSPTTSLSPGEKKKLSEVSRDPAIGSHLLLKDTILTAMRVNDSICLTMPTSRGPLALACKSTNVTAPPTPPPLPTCSSIGQSCYDGHSKSQSLFNFTGVAVHCVKETLNKVFYEQSDCIPDPNDAFGMSLLTPFPVFLEQMKAAIRAIFALYILFFGIKTALNPQNADLNSAATFVIKLLLVMYFSVGLGPLIYENGKPVTKSGMLEYVLPTLVDATPEFAQMVFNAGGARGLCEFNTSKYQPGYKFYGLWDAIDCRIGYYLGVALLYNTDDSGILQGLTHSEYSPPGSNNIPIDLGTPGSDGIDTLDSPVALRFFSVMFGFLMGGNIIVVAAGIAFAVVFISVILYFLSSYLVFMITLYTMAYISPIFIPMALFERTKAYYDSWLKILVSCALQPAVLAGFVAVLLTMYDTAIYKNCEFKRHDYTVTDVNFSTFEIMLPNSSPEDCINSAGYKLLKYYIGQGWEHIGLILIKIHYIRDIFSLIIDLLYVIVFTIIFYYFSKSMGQFAADITNGPVADAVAVGPTKVIDAIRSAGSFIANVARGGGGVPPGGGGGGGGSGSGDTGSTGRSGGPSGDSSSLGKGGSSDSGSIGGSASGGGIPGK